MARWAGPPSPPGQVFSFSQERLKLLSTEGQPALGLGKLVLAKMYGSREAGSGVASSGDGHGPWSGE